MKTPFKTLFVMATITMCLLLQSKVVAQQNSFSWNDKASDDSIFMTWNKNTPESEMKDDIKALSEKGITIKYSNVKRNSDNEITSIRVEYNDKDGNNGSMEMNQKKPINSIKFYKNGDEIGFGEPNNSNDMFAMNDFSNPQDLMKHFNFKGDDGGSQSFSFSFPGNEKDKSFSKSKSRVMIKRDDKKPLVIEDGKVIEGGDDYTPEELDKIKNENKSDGLNWDDDNENRDFDFRSQDGLDNFKRQMEQMQNNMKSLQPNDHSKADFDKTKEEMLKAKEEMIKAREELEQAKKELQKSKSKLKTQKA